jgi:hypothetical protein
MPGQHLDGWPRSVRVLTGFHCLRNRSRPRGGLFEKEKNISDSSKGREFIDQLSWGIFCFTELVSLFACLFLWHYRYIYIFDFQRKAAHSFYSVSPHSTQSYITTPATRNSWKVLSFYRVPFYVSRIYLIFIVKYLLFFTFGPHNFFFCPVRIIAFYLSFSDWDSRLTDTLIKYSLQLARRLSVSTPVRTL